jgi:hypothetical protein
LARRAKFGVKSWLERHGFVVTDWDTVRTSWRSSRKPYDLIVNNCKIEIVSAIADFEQHGKK